MSSYIVNGTCISGPCQGLEILGQFLNPISIALFCALFVVFIITILIYCTYFRKNNTQKLK